MYSQVKDSAERMSSILQKLSTDRRTVESLAAIVQLLQFCLSEVPKILEYCERQDTKIASQHTAIEQLHNEVNTLRQKLGMPAE